MKQIQFALVGCGRIGQRHAEHMLKHGRLVAVCDIVADKTKNFVSQYGALAYTDLQQMLQMEPTIEVIAVCTPNGLHAAHSIAALEAGKHVICEKPMALSTADCQAMITAAMNAGKILFPVKQNRFNPPVVAVKKLLDDGALGRICSIQLSCFWNRNADYYHNSWRGTRALDGGTLFTQFSHFIDLLYWLVGDVKCAYSLSSNSMHEGVIEFEDTGAIALQFDNGALGTINYTVNSFGKNMEGSLTIFGTKGTVKIGGEYLNTLEYQRIDSVVVDNLPAGNSANNYGSYTGSMSNHDKVYDNFVAVLNNEAAPYASTFDALKTVEIIERIYASAQKLNSES